MFRLLIIAVLFLNSAFAVTTSEGGKKLSSERINHFISPYEDMKWAGEQVALLERLSATDGMSSEVVAGLLERCNLLSRYIRKVQRRISLTGSLFISASIQFSSSFSKKDRLTKKDYLHIAHKKKECYSFSLDEGRKVWSDLHLYHYGFLEGHIEDRENVIATIKEVGSCVRRVDFKRVKYSSKDIPNLLRDIELMKGYISSFGVPSAASLLIRLDAVQWDIR